MKKIIVMFSVIVVICMSLQTTEDLIIPNEAIRIRVIANSNSSYDQLIKKVVRDKVEQEIVALLYDVENIDEARNVIKNNLKEINTKVDNVLEANNYDVDYQVNYGYHLFPEKKYKGVVYEKGYYESIVITIGEGKGDNWWCVLFPPLCLMESNANKMEEIEYKSFIKEIIDKYF